MCVIVCLHTGSRGQFGGCYSLLFSAFFFGGKVFCWICIHFFYFCASGKKKFGFRCYTTYIKMALIELEAYFPKEKQKEPNSRPVLCCASIKTDSFCLEVFSTHPAEESCSCRKHCCKSKAHIHVLSNIQGTREMTLMVVLDCLKFYLSLTNYNASNLWGRAWSFDAYVHFAINKSNYLTNQLSPRLNHCFVVRA